MLKTLRQRLSAAIFGLALGVTAAFAGGLYIAFELAEDRLFDTHLARDVEALMALYAHDPTLAVLPHDNFTIHVAPDGVTGHLPDYIRALAIDDDELLLDGVEYQVAIREHDGTRYYFLFDESAMESFEQVLFASVWLLIGGIVIVTAWLSHYLSRRVIEPLSDLSREVAAIDLQDTHAARIDVLGQSPDEIGVLARTIAAYHKRISALLRREHEFAADVSHELRTPLMSTQGASELLVRRSADDPGLGELAARIRRGCQQMTTLTEALLFLARDPASFEDLVEPVSIDRVVDNQIAVVSDLAERKGIRFRVEHGEKDVEIRTIPAVANIVIGNIIKNAVKYTNRNEVSVFVTARAVVIQDYGPGIDRAAQQFLFDRFNRGANRNPDGSGIGLALVRRFCEQYGWVIDFESELDKGTRVAVAF